MQNHDEDHGVRRPTVHVAHKAPERHHELQVFHVLIGQVDGGTVVKHEHDAGDGQNKEKQEGQPAQSPGVIGFDGTGTDPGRMQMEPNVAENVLRAVARGVFPGSAAEHGTPHLAVDDFFFNLLEIYFW
jgi:hypothetical protein